MITCFINFAMLTPVLAVGCRIEYISRGSGFLVEDAYKVAHNIAGAEDPAPENALTQRCRLAP